VSGGNIRGSNLHDRAYYEEKFFNWLAEHKLTPQSGEHFVKMLENFANNDDIIEHTNNLKLSYTLGHNQFSAMTLEEWKQYVKLGLDKPSTDSQPASIHAAPADLSTLP